MFVDRIKIYVKAGNGGNGCISFLREKYLPKGGPNGGNGGNGSSVILRADKSRDSLVDLKYQQHVTAKSGEPRQRSDRHGATAEDLVVLGAVIELVHLATLVHDDILDDADTRHRQQTAAKKYGPEAAVLIGDVLFSQALKLAAEFDTTKVCRSVAQATVRVCAGEIAQTYQRGDVNYDRDFYFRVIQLKTAELFEVSCRLGAEIAGYSEAFSKAAGLFGRHIGIAYQLFDDLVDLYAAESMIGKTLGTDLRKGKFTLPILLLLEKLPKTERDDLLIRLKNGDITGVEELINRLHDFPIFEEVVEVFEIELGRAVKSIIPFEDLGPVAHMQKIIELVRSQLGRIAH